MTQQHSSTLFLIGVIAFVDIIIWTRVNKYPKGETRRFLLIGGISLLVGIVALLSTFVFA